MRLLFLCLLLGLGIPSAAQEKPVPPPAPADSAAVKRVAAHQLPAIDLPEFVIMGTEKVSFVQSHKQLIDLYRSERFTQRSGVGTREMNISTETPTSTASLLADPEEPLYDGLARAGLGRFLSPFAEAWYARKFPVGDLSLHALYDNVKRFEGYPGLMRGEIDLTGGSFIHAESDPFFARSRVQGSFEFSHRQYAMGRWLLPSLAPASGGGWLFDRAVRDIAYDGAIISRDNPILDYSARLFASHTILSHPEIRYQPEGFRTTTQENIFGGAVTAGKRFERYSLNGDLTAALYTQSSEPGPQPGEPPLQTPAYLRLGARGSTWFGGNLTLSAGLAAYLYRGNSEPTSFRLFPTARLTYFSGNELRAWISFDPGMDQSSMRDQLRRNPFLYDERHVPAERRIDLSAGAEYQADPTLRLSLAARYLRAEHYPQEQIFRAGTGIDSLFSRFRTFYDGSSSLLAISFRARKEFTGYDHVDAELAVNASRNDASRERLTGVPDIRFDARYERRFDFPLTLSAGMTFTGERLGSTFPVVALPSVPIFWCTAQYRVWKALDLFLRAENLFGAEYEIRPGYAEQPFFLLTGLSWQF